VTRGGFRPIRGSADPRATVLKLEIMQDDHDLLTHSTRARIKGGVMVVEVAVITWDAQRPRTHWVEVLHLIETASAAVVEAARRAVLLDPAFFVVCRACARRRPLGHTAGGTCHSCQGEEHGIGG
jgi:hypothetical protein